MSYQNTLMETEVIEDMDTKGRKIRQIVDPEENNPKSKVFLALDLVFSSHLLYKKGYGISKFDLVFLGVFINVIGCLMLSLHFQLIQ